MKRRLIQFITTYFLFVFIFILQKPIFMAYYYTLYNKVSWTDWFSVIGHGLPLDLSLAGYLTILPGLLLIASAWTDSRILQLIRRIYFTIISILLSCIFISDLGLYGYWGFRLDTTPLFYFFSSPKDALASVSLWVVAGGILAMAVYAVLLYFVFSWILVNEKRPLKIPYRRLSVSGVLLLATGLLFIPIRGGFSVSTMNLGRVFFSADQRLNHAAINPAFSLLDSFSRQADFDKQYRFMPAEEADILFSELTDKPVTDSIPRLFNTERPNIIMIILESFSSHLMETLGGEPGIAVNMDEFAKEGILFTHFYANSFRTDRGLVSIISGYPAQPTTSIMKYTRKTQSLPSIPASLKKAGYDLQYYYGGDADFTNMRSYLVSTGIEKIVSQNDFPVSERLSKWGVHDHILFHRILTDLKTEPQQEPFFKILQTSSSHEPFEVPYSKLSNAKLNAFAYTDSCAGDFVRQLKETPLWKNSVVLFVPDHLGVYPESIDHLSPERYTIPLILTGGAVKEPQRITAYGSQIDIAATLLAQLGLPHDDFTFSKNILNPSSPHFAFFTFPNIFGMVTADNEVVFNCESNTVAMDEGTHQGENLNKGKAYLQKLYDDLAKR
ncbi:sulfatase-like hydrolase/transferase [Bacteroides salyersiae]|jgi:phosphoglycerol transferase MdoB-like AlkP superfamily enzyme|uniref:LTA synthase family protein n=1 Tax=Bacteroides salyersiae TaxID=291644 RepID=UPI00186487FE|nr:alkaline phosphatase family protein [Bacteroides salyersiae]UBD16167.1 sulfatase-like hydrolase/transferase [Bacteroides salyersiae]UBD65148.1 sulfatase-like hydrolase/transferase [Bacteroides salyersiae]